VLSGTQENRAFSFFSSHAQGTAKQKMAVCRLIYCVSYRKNLLKSVEIINYVIHKHVFVVAKMAK